MQQQQLVAVWKPGEGVILADKNAGAKENIESTITPQPHNPGMHWSSRSLTLGTVELFLRSGMSALLGLLAFPSMGLAGAIPFPPTALPPAFRAGMPSSLRSPSAVLV